MLQSPLDRPVPEAHPALPSALSEAPASKIETILLATDLTSASDVATAQAIDLAASIGARLLVVHVIATDQPAARDAAPRPLGMQESVTRVDQQRASREARCSTIVERARMRGTRRRILALDGRAGSGHRRGRRGRGRRSDRGRHARAGRCRPIPAGLRLRLRRLSQQLSGARRPLTSCAAAARRWTRCATIRGHGRREGRRRHRASPGRPKSSATTRAWPIFQPTPATGLTRRGGSAPARVGHGQRGAHRQRPHLLRDPARQRAQPGQPAARRHLDRARPAWPVGRRGGHDRARARSMSSSPSTRRGGRSRRSIASAS